MCRRRRTRGWEYEVCCAVTTGFTTLERLLRYRCSLILAIFAINATIVFMGTMNVSLPDDLIEFVREETMGGGYGNNSDVVRDGLRLLRERKQKRKLLLELLDEGHDDAVAGRTTPMTESRLRDVGDRARARARKREGEP